MQQVQPAVPTYLAPLGERPLFLEFGDFSEHFIYLHLIELLGIGLPFDSSMDVFQAAQLTVDMHDPKTQPSPKDTRVRRMMNP